METFFAFYRNLVRLAAAIGLLFICCSMIASFGKDGGIKGFTVRYLSGEAEEKSSPEELFCMKKEKDRDAFFCTPEEELTLSFVRKSGVPCAPNGQPHNMFSLNCTVK